LKNFLVNIEDLLLGPEQDIEHFVIQEIDKAEKKIHIMVFWFTWIPIANALLRAAHRGVDVKIILDKRSFEDKIKDVDQKRETNIPKYLIANGIDKNKIKMYNGELLHHKMIIIDKEKALTGTCNFFNASINRHDESYMLIRSRQFSSIFLKHFKYLWENKTQ
tara:strand:- start:4297 stop:4785 length:489 start_codon:yes stop_codon:yes gene_type:complete